jgi:probable rRNA maturation factor
VDVHVFDDQTALKLPSTIVQAIASSVVASEGHTYDEVSIHFVDTQTISELHQHYFNDPAPTDCISFPIDDPSTVGYKVLGDIFVCPEVAVEYSQAHGYNPYEEMTLYIVHGLLHLLGYDDIEDPDRALMRSAEQRHIASLKELGLSFQT